MWTASYHLISGRLFLDPPPSISAFSALSPPCCHNDSNLWSRASCRYAPNESLAGMGGRFCLIGRKWLMRSLNVSQEILQKRPLFQLAAFREADRNEEVQEKSPEGLPTAACDSTLSLFEFDGKQVAG